jgi:hypothetical protein
MLAALQDTLTVFAAPHEGHVIVLPRELHLQLAVSQVVCVRESVRARALAQA